MKTSILKCSISLRSNFTLLFILFLLNGFSQQVRTVENKEGGISLSGGVDLFVVDINTHLCLNFNNKFSLGIEAGIGANFSTYIFVAGSHFSSNRTIIRFQQRDDSNGEYYVGLLNAAIFTRLFLREKHPIDIGLRVEPFIHVDDSDDDFGSGLFTGVYAKYFFPTPIKEKNGRYKRRIAFGVKMTAGIFSEYSTKEFGMTSSFWVRIFFNYSRNKLIGRVKPDSIKI